MLCVGLAAPAPAHAFRPLLTDDASVNPRGRCQLETFHTGGQAPAAWSIAPACGVGAELELGLEFARTRPRVDDRGGVGVQLKGALPTWTRAGFELGYKVGAFALRNDAARDGRPDAYQAVALLTRPLDAAWTAHANLGAAWDRADPRTLGVYGAALTRAFGERGFVFGELTGTHRSAAVQHAGARWWLVPERLGIDLTVGRVAGAAHSSFRTIGLAYYGFGAFD